MSNKKKNMLTPIFTKYSWYPSFELPDKKEIPFSYSNKKLRYYNCATAFDIEVSSFMVDGVKQSTMYVWQFSFAGRVVMGRTWTEFIEFISTVAEYLETTIEQRLIVYVHNLGYEFQNFRHYFEWKKVFAVDELKPVYALTINGIEFRCSYLLSGYGLAKLGDQLHKYPQKKMVGDLDYDLIRHSETPLTDKEIGYCVQDVQVIVAYISEIIEQCGGIAKIPITKTGFVRQHCRNACYHGGKRSHKKTGYTYLKYKELMQQLTLEPDEYKQLKRAFQGGYTHTSAWQVGKIHENVRSMDFTSSYPAVMLAEEYPMAKAEYIPRCNKETFEKSIDLYCCVFDVRFDGLESTYNYESFWSASKCSGSIGVIEDNGRIVSATQITTTMTEVDFKVFRRCYKWQRMSIANFRRYRKAYLPTAFVKAILEMYATKTTLKDVKGKESEYQNGKEMLNSAYGMTVTDIVRELIEYVEEWTHTEPDIETAIQKYNKSANRFLFYPWGVWVTAYARRNLWTGIMECKADYIYSDTDSVKLLNFEKHKPYFDGYNYYITKRIERALSYHGIPLDAYRPKTIKGIEKPLGVWDFDGDYTMFKTLGAKRYMVVKGDGKLSLTVSGVDKNKAVPYLLEKYNGDTVQIMRDFKDGWKIPEGHSGRMIHTYLNEPISGYVTDYLGNTARYSELSGVHMENSEYTLSMSDKYLNYILSIRSDY